MGLIDLNTTEDDETLSSSSFSSHSGISTCGSALPPSVPSSVCLELWHACAGPMISLPKKGSVVVYFPQGHFEKQVQDFPITACNISPHVFCRVLDVKLHAEEGSDEVYCQLLLIPESEQMEQNLREGVINVDGEEEDAEAIVKSTTPHMFCKTLTASDTSTHGGFSVPRRAAEDCFPPLDYSQQRPSQELVAKDLHGLEWRFRHIYRGQPRRHLLTTGWSAFVNKKKLTSGDAVLFLRGEDGELRLGIRRAAQLKSGTFAVPSSQQLNPSTLMDVVNALSTRCAFRVCYNPRVSSSEFIIPLHKFSKSLDCSYSVGMRFRMRFETEDAAERRFTGLIAGISDVDPVRWPGSKWRCLLVRWDDMETARHNRVSPWEIEPSGSASTTNNLMAASLKRSRIGLSSEKLEFPVPNGIGASDFGESSRFRKVLQGQEMSGVNTPFDGINAQSSRLSELGRCYPGSNCSGFAATGNNLRIPQVSSDFSCNGIGFGGSYGFQKVLQGQEILPSQPYGRALSMDEARGNGRFGLFDGYHHMLSSRNGWSAQMHDNSSHLHASVQPGQVSSPSSVLMFQQAVNPVLNADYNNKHNQAGNVHYRGLYATKVKGGVSATSPSVEPIYSGHAQEATNSFGMFNLRSQLGGSRSYESVSALRNSQEMASSRKSSCRLFGFSLTEDRNLANKEADPSSVTCQLNSGPPFARSIEDEFHPGRSLGNKAVGSNCTNGVLQY
ncbi:hypothetical protein TanjilG_26570 [Lupinus angustifolius]|uniref:Auxin response factor n=1 Tax=Lupinus angustifolius TaxID=3871 RepID=A0A4P1QPP4_LUPAN|nr:PREDICTED: auxin response factor 3-like [Lupinus angustifolius]OIV91717.1 hypothetical protein TanjilG_26570 [Lupinus angustifolius]